MRNQVRRPTGVFRVRRGWAPEGCAQDETVILVKDSAVGEDEASRAEKQLDSVTKKNTDVIDDLLKNKESELLEV